MKGKIYKLNNNNNNNNNNTRGQNAYHIYQPQGQFFKRSLTGWNSEFSFS